MIWECPIRSLFNNTWSFLANFGAGLGSLTVFLILRRWLPSLFSIHKLFHSLVILLLISFRKSFWSFCFPLGWSLHCMLHWLTQSSILCFYDQDGNSLLLHCLIIVLYFLYLELKSIAQTFHFEFVSQGRSLWGSKMSCPILEYCFYIFLKFWNCWITKIWIIKITVQLIQSLK